MAEPLWFWLLVVEETEVYSISLDWLWTAGPGDWYRASLIEEGYVLVEPEQNPDGFSLWIELDARVVLIPSSN